MIKKIQPIKSKINIENLTLQELKELVEKVNKKIDILIKK